MEINCVIIDDEPNNVENLEGILARWCTGVSVKGHALNMQDGIRLIQSTNPDLVFLDIQMPGGSGFDLLKALNTVNFEVVFVTAFDQYGIQAIKFSALDYLLKPIDVYELQRSIEKVKTKFITKQQNQNIENLLQFLKTPPKELPRIALPTLHETRYVRVNDIIRCEASDNYTNFFLKNGETILVCKTLKEFSVLLKPYEFHRTHQSHLVNFQYIKSFLKEDGGILLLEDKTKVPISRQNVDAIKKILAGMS